MNKAFDNLVLPKWLQPWERFWFAPADPSLLALIRFSCGLIIVYTFAVYSLSLQDFMGQYGWHDLELRDQIRHRRPVNTGIPWAPVGVLPEPKDQHEQNELNAYFARYQLDLRVNGLPIPQNDFQKEYLYRYTDDWKVPPPAYPKDEEERAAINAYMEEFKTDPRRLYDIGTPVWSVWFHITDPDAMAIVHGIVIVISVLFTIGFGTRLTTALTWFCYLCYIHRNPTSLFGVDTMITILLTYLMISPCGAVFSVDAVLRRWWARNKAAIVQGWRRWWKRPEGDPIVPALAPEPQPSAAANVAIRLIQIHVCIIYLMAGLSKLQGQTWWNGTALWLTLGNYEFAPMDLGIYMSFLRFLGRYPWIYDAFMTAGGLFTLTFEIGYTFLIWRPKLRWVMLGSAILLHGFIGLFMGLKTFSLIMLVMNMAFLRKEEVDWFFRWFGAATTSAAATATVAKEPVAAAAQK